MIDFVHMDLVPGTKPLDIQEGQMIMVDFEGARIGMEVICVYPDGTFDGKVDWVEA